MASMTAPACRPASDFGSATGRAGAYLADTLSSVFGTAPQAVSAGSAATANVGTYAITLSNNNPAIAISQLMATRSWRRAASNGYPGDLDLSGQYPRRTYGSANPAFIGTVTGFVNTDTLAPPPPVR